MSGCDPITYRNITQSVFDCLKNTLENAGAKIPAGNEGESEGYGVKGHFKWDGKAILTVTIVSKPLILPCGTIIGKFNDVVHDCGGS